MTRTVTLPWPPAVLSPNSRDKHRYTTSERRAYKEAAWALAKEARFPACDHLRITFYPPNAIRRDLDNCLASVKYGLDGIALATGQDDSEWSLTIRKAEPVRPHGCVVIEAAEAQND